MELLARHAVGQRKHQEGCEPILPSVGGVSRAQLREFRLALGPRTEVELGMHERTAVEVIENELKKTKGASLCKTYMEGKRVPMCRFKSSRAVQLWQYIRNL